MGVRVHMPRLAPGVKPVGRQTIDWTNPLTIGLRKFWVPIAGDNLLAPNGLGVPCLVTGEMLQNNQTVAGRDVKTVPTPAGIGLQQYYSTVSMNFDAINYSDDEPYTMAGASYVDSTGIDSDRVTLFSPTNAFGAGGVWNRRNTYLRLCADAGEFSIGSGGFTNLRDSVITTVVTTDGGGASGSTVNAWQIETGEHKQSTGLSTANTLKNHYTTFVGSKTQWLYWALWDRDLSETEAYNFGRDPYQFLKPATPDAYIDTTPPTPNDRVWII